MAISRFGSSGFKTGLTKYDDMLAGYPPKMATPTAADGGTGTTATVSFTAVTGATSYTALSTPGSFSGTGASSPVTVSGLTAGTPYTFQVSATNSVGTGAYSDASNSVTPVVPTAYSSIATVTAAGGETSLTFSSIPQTYTDLQIRAIYKDTYSGGVSYDKFLLTFNGDSGTNYAWHCLAGNGTTATGTGSTTVSSIQIWGGTTSNSSLASMFGASIIDIANYTNTSKYKTLKALAGSDGNISSTSFWIALHSGLWMSTSAVTSITLSKFDTAIAAGTTFALYGIKAAS